MEAAAAAANASPSGMTAALEDNAVVTSATPLSSAPAEDEVTRLQKRYDALMMVRTKAIKGKGAWYWAHLVPLLQSSDSGLPKAVKLRCTLCDALFSASNPSRTASEHLKRGTCPNFSPSSPTPSPAKPISSLAPRKRPPSSASSYKVSPLSIVDPSRFLTATPDFYSPSSATHHHHHLILSGGKDDLEALAVLEDNVKKLKSPKGASPGAPLSKLQVDSALSHLADWVHETVGAVSFSALDHPRFRAFLQQVGLPPLSQREITGARLDARYKEVWIECEARIRDVLFFQIAADAWKGRFSGEEGMVSLVLNLPNGTSIFRRALFVAGKLPAEFAEEILWETVTGVCGSNVHRCAGIVSNRFRSRALRELESRNQWMVNLPCQLQGLHGLVKDLLREFPLCQSVIAQCSKVAHLFNTSSCFHKYKLHSLDQAGLLRELPVVSLLPDSTPADPADVVLMLEDVLASSNLLHSAVVDDIVDDPPRKEIVKIIRDVHFWHDLEAVHSLVGIFREMARDMEAERPFVGQCLQLWDDLRLKVKEWCAKFGVDGGHVGEMINKRFRKNYHPAWSAAFVLDPLYLMRDTSGKFLPPFKCLTPEQEKDVDRLITRLVSPEEKHIALMELLKWRSEGLDRDYALAVQIKQRDPTTGKTKIANPQISRLVWESHLREFKALGKVAVRLIFLHATSCGFKCNSSFLRWVSSQRRSREGMERAHKLVFVAVNAKLERRDLSSEEEKDAKLFMDNDDDDVSNEVLMDAAAV